MSDSDSSSSDSSSSESESESETEETIEVEEPVAVAAVRSQPAADVAAAAAATAAAAAAESAAAAAVAAAKTLAELLEDEPSLSLMQTAKWGDRVVCSLTKHDFPATDEVGVHCCTSAPLRRAPGLPRDAVRVAPPLAR